MIIVSGLSGAGKTIALHTLEDIGYYCIDNLPASLLPALYEEQKKMSMPVAVGIDIRSQPDGVKAIPQIIEQFKRQDNQTRVLFVSAQANVLIRRFNESRRKHPLTNDNMALSEAIEYEKSVLSPLRLTTDCHIDTSQLNIYDLKDRIADWLDIKEQRQPTVTIESFGFKKGVPINADLMFDVRFLPNPYWENELRNFTGQDKVIQTYLSQFKETNDFISDTIAYLHKRLPAYLNSSRSYLTISIGCTGGKHRSVYVTEKIAAILSQSLSNIHIRHRDLQQGH